MEEATKKVIWTGLVTWCRVQGSKDWWYFRICCVAFSAYNVPQGSSSSSAGLRYWTGEGKKKEKKNEREWIGSEFEAGSTTHYGLRTGFRHHVSSLSFNGTSLLFPIISPMFFPGCRCKMVQQWTVSSKVAVEGDY